MGFGLLVYKNAPHNRQTVDSSGGARGAPPAEKSSTRMCRPVGGAAEARSVSAVRPNNGTFLAKSSVPVSIFVYLNLFGKVSLACSPRVLLIGRLRCPLSCNGVGGGVGSPPDPRHPFHCHSIPPTRRRRRLQDRLARMAPSARTPPAPPAE